MKHCSTSYSLKFSKLVWSQNPINVSCRSADLHPWPATHTVDLWPQYRRAGGPTPQLMPAVPNHCTYKECGHDLVPSDQHQSHLSQGFPNPQRCQVTWKRTSSSDKDPASIPAGFQEGLSPGHRHASAEYAVLEGSFWNKVGATIMIAR